MFGITEMCLLDLNPTNHNSVGVSLLKITYYIKLIKLLEMSKLFLSEVNDFVWLNKIFSKGFFSLLLHKNLLI
jgi:hypothetical protein